MSKNLCEQIYAYESLAYYFGIKPNEYWDCDYKTIKKYCEMQFVKVLDDYKQEIILGEAVSDKLIKADAMSNKNPKILSLKDKFFKKLF